MRSVWYGLTEPVALRWHRLRNHLNDPYGVKWNIGRPLVSVYIPTRNRKELLLDQCLPSVLSQTYDNLEIVVVCHGCTDGTGAAVRNLNDPRVRVVGLKREIKFPQTVDNFYFAVRVQPSNLGLELCTGAFISTIDDDDEWMPDHIETSVKFAQWNDLEFVSSAHIDDKGWVAPYNIWGVNVGGIQTWVYRDYLSGFKFNPQCWRKNWNRVCDTDLQQRFINAGVRMGYLNKVGAVVNPREGYDSPGVNAYRADPDRYLAEMA